MAKCDICGGDCWAGSSSGTCSDCLRTIIANSMVEDEDHDEFDEDDEPVLLECDHCGEEFTIDEMIGTRCHDCYSESQDIGPATTEPDDEDLVTSDYLKFYRHGFRHHGPVVECREGDKWANAVTAYMDREEFWPNVWYIGERGDVDLIDMFEALHSEDDS